MIVVAGPSGSGKSTLFPVSELCSAAFNVDDRAAELHGSYVGTPPTVRRRAQLECESFVAGQIASGVSFAVETTLRSDAALRQAARARSAGFTTMLIYLCSASVEQSILRVARRGALGGHSAPEAEIRDIYTKSLGHLVASRRLFDTADLFDTSEPWSSPRRVVELRHELLRTIPPIPEWVPDAWRG